MINCLVRGFFFSPVSTIQLIGTPFLITRQSSCSHVNNNFRGQRNDGLFTKNGSELYTDQNYQLNLLLFNRVEMAKISISHLIKYIKI